MSHLKIEINPQENLARLNWWQEVAERRAIVHTNPNSEDARAQGIWRRFKDCIIHFFAQLSADYKAFYDTQICWQLIFDRDAQYRMNPVDGSMPQAGKNAIDALGPPVQPKMETRDYEGIMQIEPVTKRVVCLLRKYQQGAIIPAIQDDAYDQLMDYCRNQKGRGGNRAMRVLNWRKDLDAYGTSGKEYFARAWIFAQLCADPEEAKMALVLGLSNAVNDRGRVVCIYGTLNHITITLFMGRLYGIAQEDSFHRTAEQYAIDFFVDERLCADQKTTKGAYRRNLVNVGAERGKSARKIHACLATDIKAYWQHHIPNKSQQQNDCPNGISLRQFQVAVLEQIQLCISANVF